MAKKQKSGLYRTKVKIGTDADGKSIPKWVSGRTQRELEENKKKARAFYIDGDMTCADRLFGEYAIEWFTVYRAPHVDPITAENYRSMLNVHILPHFGDRQLRAIRAADVQVWFNGFIGSSESLINKLFSLITDIFRSAVSQGILIRDVTTTLKKPRAKKSKGRRALHAAETAAVLRTIKHHIDGLFLAVLYYLGLRRGEALGLKWSDFDFVSGMVHIQRDVIYVRGKTTVGDLKSEAADRFILLPTPLIALLLPLVGSSDAWVFSAGNGEPLCLTSFKRLWMGLMFDAGLVEPKELSPAVQRKIEKKSKHLELMDMYTAIITAHYLRHDYITKLFYAGFDAVIAMWMAGHESYETTVDFYTHLRKSRFQEPPTDMEWVYELKKEAYKIQIPERAIEAQREKSCTKVAQI